MTPPGLIGDMIGRELLKTAVTQKIKPAITHMREVIGMFMQN
jgi:hypothetical protein